MKTVEVSNSYNIRRRQLTAELEYAEKELRGFLTRSVLNTDLSAKTYEVLINSIIKIREFDRFRILEVEKKVHEVKKWISDYSDSINRIINNNNRKNLVQPAQNLESLLTRNPEHLSFLEQFYLDYFDINLSLTEDTLIQVYISEDNSTIYGETLKMLNDLVLLHPLGGLTSIIKGILETYKLRYVSYDMEDTYMSYIELFCDTTFIWTQTAQLLIDYITTLEHGGNVTLENSNDHLESRMKGLVDVYQGKIN